MLGVLLVGLAATATGVVAQSRRDEDPVARLAVAGRSARVEATVDAVPRPVTGSAAPGSVLVRVRVTSLRSGGESTAAHASVTVLADRTWSRLEPGSRMSATLRFRVRRGISADAAFAIVRGPPTLLAGPGRLRTAPAGSAPGWPGSAHRSGSLRPACCPPLSTATPAGFRPS